MTDSIITAPNYAELIEVWKQQEREGVQFPVPLHDHSGIAGHTTKRKAFDLAKSRLDKGFDFTLGSKKPQGKGRRVLTLNMTVEALELFCMAAHTPEGDTVRRLYRQAKQKWDTVQAIAPQFAQDVEILTLKAEIAKQEAIKAKAEESTISLRHYVTTSLPEPIQQKILGYKTIDRVEYRDRTFVEEDLVNDGSTMAQREAMERLGVTRRELKSLYETLPLEAFDYSRNVVENKQLKRDYFAKLQEMHIQDPGRQRYIGE